MQRLDPPVHHFRKTGQLGNILHRQTLLAKKPRRPARADQFDPEFLMQPARKFHQSGLVGNRNQRTFHGNQV
jgi:hypothetical protein